MSDANSRLTRAFCWLRRPGATLRDGMMQCRSTSDAIDIDIHGALLSAGVGTWQWDACSDRVMWSEELAAILGVDGADRASSPVAMQRFVHPFDQERVAVALQHALATREPLQLELRIVRPDQTTRWLEVRASLTISADGVVSGASGAAFDVTDRRLQELQREDVQARLALLAEVTTTLASSLHADEVLERLATLVMPGLCDVVLLDCIDDEGLPQSSLIRAAKPETTALLERAERLSPRRYNMQTAAGRALFSGQPALVQDVTEEYIRARLLPAAAEDYMQAGVCSAVVAPLLVRGTVIGIMSMYATADSGRRYEQRDADLAVEIGRRAGLALDNARLYAAERNIAETLQRALLPALPRLTGLEVAARYLPSGGPAQEVGGDWFDLFATSDGAVSFTVGDVAGHDLRAAAAMAHARSALRAYAADGASPTEVIRSLARHVDEFPIADLITVGYGRLHPGTDPRSGYRLVWASAGHPPPLLLRADGQAEFLDVDVAPPLGVGAGIRASQIELPLRDGDLLLCYTDGLIETRTDDIEAGLQRLMHAASAHRSETVGNLCDAVVADLRSRIGDDDIALLAIRVGPTSN
jgi:serine phosphatase RsbU (regulator of sigma subunit)